MKENKLYVIAGDRMMKGAIAMNGLFANVGQTTRTVYDRIKDKDYQQKSGAGAWQVIIEDAPLGEFKDFHIHEFLRERDDVKWDANSSNTEEFHFITDIGDGKEARRIVKECLNNLRPHPSDVWDMEGFKERAIQKGIQHAGSVNHGMVWFKIKSFTARVDRNQRRYLVINFINTTEKYNNVFCFAWYGEYPKIGSIWFADVKEGKRSLTTTRKEMRECVIMNKPVSKEQPISEEEKQCMKHAFEMRKRAAVNKSVSEEEKQRMKHNDMIIRRRREIWGFIKPVLIIIGIFGWIYSSIQSVGQ